MERTALTFVVIGAIAAVAVIFWALSESPPDLDVGSEELAWSDELVADRDDPVDDDAGLSDDLPDDDAWLDEASDASAGETPPPPDFDETGTGPVDAAADDLTGEGYDDGEEVAAESEEADAVDVADAPEALSDELDGEASEDLEASEEPELDESGEYADEADYVDDSEYVDEPEYAAPEPDEGYEEEGGEEPSDADDESEY